MIQGKEVPRLEIPKCPRCGSWSLVRHGTYIRKMRDESGIDYEIEIQRVRCIVCPKQRTHSLLYDFLVPYCRSNVRALEQAVTAYVSEPNTYLGALNEAVSDAAMLFRMIEKMLLNLPLVWMQIVSTLIAAGYSVDEISTECSSPNSFKCRTRQKQVRLDWAAQLLRLLPNVIRIANQNGFSLFSSGRGCKLLRTHSRECKLF